MTATAPTTTTKDRRIATRWIIGERGNVQLAVELVTSHYKRPDYHTGGIDAPTFQSHLSAVDIEDRITRTKFSFRGPYRGGTT